MEKVAVIFNFPQLTAKEYDKVWNDLRAAGSSNPKGLISHVGFARPEGGWTVVDVWESADAFAEFGKILQPIMQKNGVEVPRPQVVPAHYVYIGQPEAVIA